MDRAHTQFGGLRSPEDLVNISEILSHAFASRAEDIAEWFTRSGLENVRTLHCGDELAAALLLIPMGQYFGGRAIPMVGIAGVAVRPDRLRQGFASTLMRESIREFRRCEVALSCLYAATGDLYSGVGYAPAGGRFIAEVSALTLPSWPRDNILWEQMTDHAEARALYEVLAPRTNGHLQRGEYMWGRILAPRYGPPALGFGARNPSRALEGYIYYQKRVVGDDRHEVRVTDLAFGTPSAGRRLWTHLHDLSPMVTKIEFETAPHDPFHLLHPNVRYPMRFVEGWYLRITHLESALEGRGWPQGLDTECVIEVEDGEIPENSGRFLIKVVDRRASVRRLDAGGPADLTTSIGGLAQLFSGFCTPDGLERLGIAAGSDSAKDRLGVMFAGPMAWMREHF